jgi:hypothetical protein
MITFQQIGSYGRLGNQLFQYAILKSISLKKGYEIVLPNFINNKIWHNQPCLLNNFKLPSCRFEENIFYEQTYSEKNLRSYDEKIYDVNDNTNFFGFFQNPKYYEDIREELISEFEIRDEIMEKITNFLSKFNTPVVSLHVRRGDLSDSSNTIDFDWVNDYSKGSILNNYYEQALRLIPSDSTILLFTGGSRENDTKGDFEWCKKFFNDERIIFVDNFNDIETFTLMKSCDINITSFASTYSWWASFLNKNNNVIAPENFYPSSYVNPDNVYPKNWKLI